MVVNAVGRDTVDKGRFLLELYQKAQSLYDKDLYNYFLEHAVQVTNSKIGFFHIVSNDQTVNLTTWNKEVLKNCTANYASHYTIKQAGNWTDCVRLKRPVIYNDFANSPNQKGLPKGHIHLTRMLSVPILENGQVSTIFGVGNKIEPYIEDDVTQLEIIANELDKIMKQRRAEVELLESKEKYQSLFANMLNGFAYCQMLFDKQGNPTDFIILEVNQAFADMVKSKKDKVLGKKASEVMALENLGPSVFKKLYEIAIQGTTAKYETHFKPLNRWLSLSLYSPKEGYFAAVFEDITERKNSEEILKESEERLKQSQEIAHVGSWIYDAAQQKISWTDQVYRIFGLKPEEFDGTFDGFLKSVPKAERKAVKDSFFETLAADEEVAEIEHRIIRKNTGETRIVHEKGYNIRDDAGKIIRSIGMVQYITEQKQAQQALLESEERLRLKLDALLSPDVEVDDQELVNIIDVQSLEVILNYLSRVTNIAFALMDLKGKVLVSVG